MSCWNWCCMSKLLKFANGEDVGITIIWNPGIANLKISESLVGIWGGGLKAILKKLSGREEDVSITDCELKPVHWHSYTGRHRRI